MVNRPRETRDSGPAAGVNVRAAERYRLSLPTVMWEMGGVRDAAVATETVDISRSGMFLSGQFPLRPGSMICFEVKLPSVGDQPGGTMVGQATVVRNDSAAKGRTGIGAIIHQCEVWPASRPTRLNAPRQSTLAGRAARSSEKRAGRDRRVADRRTVSAKARRAKVNTQERRRAPRRSAAPRRKG